MKYLITEGDVTFCLNFASGQMIIGGRKATVGLIESFLDRLAVAPSRRSLAISQSTFRVRFTVVFLSNEERKRIWDKLCEMQSRGYSYRKVHSFGRLMR